MNVCKHVCSCTCMYVCMYVCMLKVNVWCLHQRQQRQKQIVMNLRHAISKKFTWYSFSYFVSSFTKTIISSLLPIHKSIETMKYFHLSTVDALKYQTK